MRNNKLHIANKYILILVCSALWIFTNGRWNMPAVAVLCLFFTQYLVRMLEKKDMFVFFILVSFASFLAYRNVAPIPNMPPFSVILNILLSFIVALILLIPYVVDRLLYNRFSSLFSTFVLPVAYVSREFLTSRLYILGSWGSLAYTQSENLAFLQILSITGIWGITFLLSWGSSIINLFIDTGFKLRTIKLILPFYLALLFSIVFWGGVRLYFYAPSSETIRIAGISAPDFIQYYIFDNYPEIGRKILKNEPLTEYEKSIVYRKIKENNDFLFQKSEIEARAKSKIIVWAEANAVVKSPDEEDSFINRGRNLAERENIFLLMSYVVWYENQKFPFENKNVLIDDQGQVLWEYTKSRPVPGFEAMFTRTGSGKIPVAETKYSKLSTSICFEMDFPDYILQAGDENVDIFLNPANDWAEVQEIRVNIAKFRAIENGFYVFRPTSNGTSVAIDYQGRIIASSNFYKNADRTIVAYVPMRGDTKTIYAKLKDYFAYACLLALLIMFIKAFLQKKLKKFPRFCIIFKKGISNN